MKVIYAYLVMIIFATPVLGLEIKQVEGSLKNLPETYIEKGACPFECCRYRTWKVEKDANIFDKPRGTRTVGKIRKGDLVEGLTGEVESRPILVTVTADHIDNSGNSFIRGDKFYLLTYRGEGFFKAWFDGKLFDMDAVGIKDAFEYYSSDPFWAVTSQRYKHVWWKKIKTRQGTIGWIKEDVFSNQDACG